MKIEQKPFKICNDSFFFLPEFFLKKLMRLFPNKMWGINPIKGKNKFQETITLGVRKRVTHTMAGECKLQEGRF